MKKLATKLTPAIKAWIKEEFGSDYYNNEFGIGLFHFPNIYNYEGFIAGSHFFDKKEKDYTLISEQDFLAEFQTKKVDYQMFVAGRWRDLSIPIRIKPQPDYTPEIEALQNKAKENGMKVTINFEKL